MRITRKLIFTTAVVGIGSGFQQGYNTGVVNEPQEVIKSWILSVYSRRRGSELSHELVTAIFSLAVSIYCAGGVLGGLCTSLFASRIGRRNSLIINNVFAINAAMFMGFARLLKTPEMFIVGRVFTGFNCGLNSGLAAVYLVEISPKEIRGVIGTVYQLILTITILLSQILGLKDCLGNEKLWPYLFGLIGIVAIGQMLLLPLCPESPKFLYVMKGVEASKKALTSLRGNDIEIELREIERELKKSKGGVATHQMFSEKVLRTPLIISIMIMLAQQLSGINAVRVYSTSTFECAGFSKGNAQSATLCMGAMNVLMAVICLFLVNRCRRKTLLLFGFGLMILNTVLLTIALNLIKHGKFFQILSAILVVSYVVSFAIGPGSIPWFLVNEMFTQEVRPLASSIAVATDWSANFVVSFLFLLIQGLIKAYVFIIFVVFQLFFFLYILFKVPETKGKTFKEIRNYFK